MVEAQFHLAVCGKSFLECPRHDLLNIRPRFIVQHTGIAAHHIDISGGGRPSIALQSRSAFADVGFFLKAFLAASVSRMTFTW